MRCNLLPLSIVLAGAASALVGCGPSYGPYDVGIGPSQTLRESDRPYSVTVDLVGVNEANERMWREKSVSEYFSGADDLRASTEQDRVSFDFSQDDAAPQTLSRKDPIWRRWRESGAVYLYVLSNQPGEDRPGDNDPRRMILDLSSEKWADRDIQIEVLPGVGGFVARGQR